MASWSHLLRAAAAALWRISGLPWNLIQSTYRDEERLLWHNRIEPVCGDRVCRRVTRDKTKVTVWRPILRSSIDRGSVPFEPRNRPSHSRVLLLLHIEDRLRDVAINNRNNRSVEEPVMIREWLINIYTCVTMWSTVCVPTRRSNNNMLKWVGNFNTIQQQRKSVVKCQLLGTFRFAFICLSIVVALPSAVIHKMWLQEMNWTDTEKCLTLWLIHKLWHQMPTLMNCCCFCSYY